MLLISTIHGSRLYGTHHEASDYDYYHVMLNVKNRQTIVEDQDVKVISLKSFAKGVSFGFPVNMEVLFAHNAILDTPYSSFLKALRPDMTKLLTRSLLELLIHH